MSLCALVWISIPGNPAPTMPPRKGHRSRKVVEVEVEEMESIIHKFVKVKIREDVEVNGE